MSVTPHDLQALMALCSTPPTSHKSYSFGFLSTTSASSPSTGHSHSVNWRYSKGNSSQPPSSNNSMSFPCIGPCSYFLFYLSSATILSLDHHLVVQGPMTPPSTRSNSLQPYQLQILGQVGALHTLFEHQHYPPITLHPHLLSHCIQIVAVCWQYLIHCCLVSCKAFECSTLTPSSIVLAIIMIFALWSATEHLFQMTLTSSRFHHSTPFSSGHPSLLHTDSTQWLWLARSVQQVWFGVVASYMKPSSIWS